MRQVDGGKETCGTQGCLHIGSERGSRDCKVTLSMQKSSETIVAERQRAKSVGVPSTTGKGGTVRNGRKPRNELPAKG